MKRFCRHKQLWHKPLALAHGPKPSSQPLHSHLYAQRQHAPLAQVKTAATPTGYNMAFKNQLSKRHSSAANTVRCCSLLNTITHDDILWSCGCACALPIGLQSSLDLVQVNTSLLGPELGARLVHPAAQMTTARSMFGTTYCIRHCALARSKPACWDLQLHAHTSTIMNADLAVSTVRIGVYRLDKQLPGHRAHPGDYRQALFPLPNSPRDKTLDTK